MRDPIKGTYNGMTTYCPVNAYGDCPYCDQRCVCHVENPVEDCDDWMSLWGEDWEMWLTADTFDPDAPTDFAEDEIKWAGDVYGYEDTMEDNENYE